MRINKYNRDGSVGVESPTKCPHCHYSIHPIIFSDAIERTWDDGPYGCDVQAVFLCPRESCESLFVGVFEHAQDEDGNYVYMLSSSYPRSSRKERFSQIISAISPKYCVIYNQALEAEQAGLDEVCGPAYRKALEFLIKDYIIHRDSSVQQHVENKQIVPCIKAYIDHPEIQAMAERAAWLGNDETHYVRKWTEYDVQMLKDLIALAVSWIELQEKTDQAKLAMAQGRK